jgi:hypothetical protein
MKFKLVTVVAAIAALSFAAAVPAEAQPLGHAKPPQVTGTRLFAVLPPASAFGAGFTRSAWGNTGSQLATTHIKDHIPNLGCNYFESHVFWGFLGDTAGAEIDYSNPNWRSTFPSSTISGYEDVLQFATTAAATTLYNQERAKYVACRSFTEPGPPGITAQVGTLSVRNTTVGGDRAFLVTELASILPYDPEYLVFLYVYSGTNVYSLQEINGTNDEPSVTLMRTIIHRVQALYPHNK